MQWVKIQKTALLHRHPFERKSLSFKAKAKGRQCRSTGFAPNFGLNRRGHKAKRSDARFIYYRKCGSASYIVREVHSVRERERERDRERERKTEVTSPLSR